MFTGECGLDGPIGREGREGGRESGGKGEGGRRRKRGEKEGGG